MFSPSAVYQNPKKQWQRFFTAGFLHADFMHLILNMYVFFSFGSALHSYFDILFEKWSNLLFVTLYITSIAVAHIPTFLKQKNNFGYASIGASGAVAAILYATILISPTSRLAVMGIPMPAIVFGVVYLAAEYFMGKRNDSRVNHDAHFWGALYGFLFTVACKPQLLLLFLEKVKEML